MVKLFIINVAYTPQNRVSDTKYHERCSTLIIPISVCFTIWVMQSYNNLTRVIFYQEKSFML